jgi:hypothetical protein
LTVLCSNKCRRTILPLSLGCKSEGQCSMFIQSVGDRVRNQIQLVQNTTLISAGTVSRLEQGWTNLVSQVSGLINSVQWRLTLGACQYGTYFIVAFLVPWIWRCFLGYWKICGSLI